MTSNTLARVSAGLSLIAALGASTAALAQAKAAAATAAPLTVAGPVIPGVCIFSNERVVQQSTVGKYVIGRLQTMDQQIRTELQPEQTAIQTEGQTLQSQRATLPQDQLQQRAVALNTRISTLDRTAQIRSRELELTQQKALARINTELGPVLQQVYNARNCGMLVDRNAVFAANPQMDITDQVVTGLNGRIQQFAFERERINAAAAPTAGATAPARPATTPPRRK